MPTTASHTLKQSRPMPLRHLLSLAALCHCATFARAEEAPAPLPPEEAPRHFTLPDGFSATLFAGEPDVVQPIALAFDDRGRLWVVECLAYPDWNKDLQAAGHDRVLIFTDRDGDGRFDERKVFLDAGNNLSGIELGFGGVWLCSTPNLVFVPDADGDDVPDGPPQSLLDGWDVNAKHNVFNNLAWGPDGWLYGCNGILSNSKVGKPGAPDEERTAINCGVWRYHPTRQTFEAVAHGTTNPWGLDFNDYGQMFITSCVIQHLWHVVPGARFERMFGQDFNPHSYSLMTGCADHLHWGGGDWTSSRGGQGVHDKPGGGHAHSGAMIYLGDNWPDEYRNDLFTLNLHGHRLNHDLLERSGSGYVARHGDDFLYANDTWFRGLVVKYGPDGGVYVSDWTDSGECHDYDDVHRTSGRIYKIVYGTPKTPPADLAALGDAELVARQLQKNDWQVSHARRILQERAAAGRLSAGTREALFTMLRGERDTTRRLRALWAVHVTGGVEPELLGALLADGDEYLRGWALQLELEDRAIAADRLARLAAIGRSDPSPLVRLHLASALQRLPLDKRWVLAEGLVAHDEDAADANLPLMLWYAIEPLVPADAERALRLAVAAKIPLLRKYIVRRATSGIPAEVAQQSPNDLAPLVAALAQVSDANVLLDLLTGVREALAGRRRVVMPEHWPQVAAKLGSEGDAQIREQTLLLSLVFGEPAALAEARRTLMDAKADAGRRQRALDALVQHHDAELSQLLEQLLDEPAIRGGAVRGLAAYGDEAAPRVILDHYASFSETERADAVATLASRPAFALALLDAVERGAVPRADISAFTVRQLAGMKDKAVDERLRQVWGEVRAPSRDKAATIAKYKQMLEPGNVQAADPSRGRTLFSRHCAACHKMFGEGGHVGPELTGAQRTNIDYLLENLIDPSALVGRDYQMSVVQTADGRVVNGIVVAEDDAVLTLQTQNERVLLPKNEIEAREPSRLSLMPEGLLDKLNQPELRELAAYLSGPRQAPLLPSAAGLRQSSDGTITLDARDVTIHGGTVRYEPQPHKNTIGYWTDARDWVSWEFAVVRPGTFEVEILQGCGTGQGGSEVELSVGAQKLCFRVQDTGGFQQFVPHRIGAVRIEAEGLCQLAVKPLRKAKNAVMDLRQVRLLPAK